MSMESEQQFGVSDVNEPTKTDEDATSEGRDSLSCGPSTDSSLSYENRPGEILKNLQNVSYIYRQDVVRKITNTGIGVVTDVAGDSDSHSSLTDDEDEEEDEVEEEGENEKDNGAGSNEEYDAEKSKNFGEDDDNNNYEPVSLTDDQVRVLWMDGSETTETTKDVEVVDRGFLHGDYVAAAFDPTGQIGVVVDVSINVDLLTHDGLILKDMPSTDLKRIRDFTIGDHVVLGPWLGRIEGVFDNVTVQLDDGSVCKVMKADPLHLKPVGKNILEDGHFPYYPGQRVKASSSSVFKNSRWLSGLWKANRLEGTVTKVTVGSVYVYWIASGYVLNNAYTPAEEQSPKNLKLLSCFAHTNWQLGDWSLLPPSQDLSCTSLNKGLSKLDSNDSAQDKPESTETRDESDVELASMEELSGNNTKSTESGPQPSLCKNAVTSDKKACAERLCNSSVPASKEAVREAWPLRKKTRKVVVRNDKKSRNKVENFEHALLIIKTHTKVDVAWQDGTMEQGVESTSLIPIDNPGDQEFVAEQYVVEKAADGDDVVETRRVGVVKSVNAKDRTACVRWLKPVARAEDPREFDKEEMVSVYELEGHPDYDYCYGDIVVRLSPISLPAKMNSFVHSIENPPPNGPDELKHEKERHQDGSGNTENLPAQDLSPEISDLSWVGNITGLKDGDIEVAWATGMISTVIFCRPREIQFLGGLITEATPDQECSWGRSVGGEHHGPQVPQFSGITLATTLPLRVGPQAIFVVGRDDESIAAGSDAGSWETVEDDMDSVDNADEHGTDNAGDIGSDPEDNDTVSENFGKNGALSIPLAAIGFMTRLASRIFSRVRKHSDEDNIQSDGLDLDIDPDGGSSSQKPNDTDNQISSPITNCRGQKNDGDASDMLEVAQTLCNLKIPQSDAPSRAVFIPTFRGFDIVRDPIDHQFLNTQGQNNAARKWLKKVQQDWGILQNNLPEGIYVRVYEDRMDLLRAVIVGAYGTPYQDGLFFFDFLLPSEYPDVPPSAYYHSGGWRINPNLYEEGKVCLSLLNTWTGRGNEVWVPSTSSILQVLVSLQGLVLNSKPYFNEAGYDKQVGTAEGEKNSLSYNENSFLLNCKTMMYLMRKPPKDFEELVIQHFRKRGYIF
ncbi:putative ubiquitin-conjugating enzyme E2 23 [Orobanche gracilis]